MVQAQDGIQLSVVVIAVAMQDGLAGPGQRRGQDGLDEAGAADDDVVSRFGQPLLVEIGIYRWRRRDVGDVVPMPTLPFDKMRIRSVGDSPSSPSFVRKLSQPFVSSLDPSWPA